MIQQAKIAHFTDRGHKVRGVVHVGAHDGQELPWYLQAAHAPVIAFEPNPDVARRLSARYQPDLRVLVVPVALGDQDGAADLWIPRHLDDASDDEQSASLLRADRESGYDWGRRDLEGRTVRVPLYRFDTWARTLPEGLRQTYLHPCNALVVDVQGLELQVLRGFGAELDRFDFLNIECSEVPIYKGGAPASEVASFLEERGFRRDSPIVDHDDVFFVRNGL